MAVLSPPCTEAQIRALKVGDKVEVTGLVYTARDAVHKWLSEDVSHVTPFSLRDQIVFHCGPVVRKKQGRWVVTAAGPTTSMREEPYQAGLIERLGLRAVIGKGGMGEKTRAACARFGCVYLLAVGGAAQVLAERIEEVEDVWGLDRFGAPEAVWKLRVARFPAVVTIDAHGGSLHEDVEKASAAQFKRFLESS